MKPWRWTGPFLLCCARCTTATSPPDRTGSACARGAPRVFSSTAWKWPRRGSKSIESWRLSHFSQLENTGPAANSGDPDADGRPNLLEYALGTNPTNAVSYADPVVTVVGDRLVLTFDRIADGSLVYAVEGTDSLTPPVWTAVWTSTGSDNTAGPVAVHDVVRISARPTRFLRLAVSQ